MFTYTKLMLGNVAWHTIKATTITMNKKRIQGKNFTKKDIKYILSTLHLTPFEQSRHLGVTEAQVRRVLYKMRSKGIEIPRVPREEQKKTSVIRKDHYKKQYTPEE